MSTRLTTRATTRRRARRRERRERYHHARIVPSSRVARAHRRDDTSSSSPRDDCARARELNEFPPPSTPRRRARVATTRDTRRTKYSSRHERARARITDRIAPYLDRWPRTTDNLRDRGSARPRARSPTNDRARRFPSDRRPIGERTANEQKKSPRARLASRALASPPGRSRARRPELSNLSCARARWMHHKGDSMVSHDRSCVCFDARARDAKQGTIRCTPSSPSL